MRAPPPPANVVHEGEGRVNVSRETAVLPRRLDAPAAGPLAATCGVARAITSYEVLPQLVGSSLPLHLDATRCLSRGYIGCMERAVGPARGVHLKVRRSHDREN
jgi:hypothetical protein